MSKVPDDLEEMNIQQSVNDRKLTVTFFSRSGRTYKFLAELVKDWEDPYTLDKMMVIRVPFVQMAKEVI